MSKMVVMFGGMFDPVHNGHLRAAIELRNGLAPDELRLIPCHYPPHREHAFATDAQRLEMMQLAINNVHGVNIDQRELKRESASYSIETLESLRADLGENASLVLAMGTDAFEQLESWHRWQDLLSLAHIVVMERPGWQLPETGALVELWERASVTNVQALKEQTQGHIYALSVPPLTISSSYIREQCTQNNSIQFLVPDAVWQYIQQQQLYTTKEAN